MCGGVPKLGVSVVAGGWSVTICGHGPRVRSQLPGVSCHQSPAAADAELNPSVGNTNLASNILLSIYTILYTSIYTFYTEYRVQSTVWQCPNLAPEEMQLGSAGWGRAVVFVTS